MNGALGREKKVPPNGRRITNRGLATGGFVLPIRHDHPLAWVGNFSQYPIIRARRYRALTRRLFKRKNRAVRSRCLRARLPSRRGERSLSSTRNRSVAYRCTLTPRIAAEF